MNPPLLRSAGLRGWEGWKIPCLQRLKDSGFFIARAADLLVLQVLDLAKSWLLSPDTAFLDRVECVLILQRGEERAEVVGKFIGLKRIFLLKDKSNMSVREGE